MCNTRPPGHHAYASDSEPSGFCFINNASIVAKYALDKHSEKVKKVLIFDWDVHHGDGSQRALYDDPNVLFISLHKFNKACFYPCNPSANFTHIGEGDGKGFNINIPWNTLTKTKLNEQNEEETYYEIPGSEEYVHICHTFLFPIIKEFKPDLIVISAGFDSARGDPLGGLDVLPKCYAYMV